MLKLLITFLIWLWLVLPAQAQELRIAIKKQLQTLSIGSSSQALVKDSQGRVLGSLEQMKAIAAESTPSGIQLGHWQAAELVIEPQDNGYIWIDQGWYRGTVRLISQPEGLIAINLIDLEQYLYSVVGSEAVPSWPLEALKAQAVAARSYALYKQQHQAEQLYDLDSTTATQVYKGLASEYQTTQQAVEATRGQVMTYEGKVILAVFHSSSGGHTENVEDIWVSSLPYLRGVVDFDQQAPVYEWTTVFTVDQISQRIPGVGKVQSLTPTVTTPRGRVKKVLVVGDRATQEWDGEKLRQTLNLRSTLMNISLTPEGNFLITGRGFGHGVGLSQWGAYYLALAGVSYRQILSHYYPGADLTQLP